MRDFWSVATDFGVRKGGTTFLINQQLLQLSYGRHTHHALVLLDSNILLHSIA